MMIDPPDGRAPSALVVDDDPHINRLLQVRLRSAGYDVRSAHDGEQALVEIAESPPDLMLLDVSMPGMGGLEVLERIREQRLDIAVIMSTAFGSENVAIDALRKGADDYLRKPFEPTELRAVVERTASRLFLRRQNEALRRQLDAELVRASEVQAGLLPDTPPILAGYDVAATCIPAREVGGDFYDWQRQHDGTLSLMIGDVMGKGMPAALLMATVRAALRPVLAVNPPAEALRLVERVLMQDLERTESFVTLFLLHLDQTTHVARFVDAGHGLASLVHADGTVTHLPAPGLPFGVMRGSEVLEHTASLEPGDTLILFSDGLSDALQESDLLEDTIRTCIDTSSSSQDVTQRLADLAMTTGSQTDDITIVVLRRCAELSP